MFWKLAYKRHFPAINWLNSYSLYADSVGKSIEKNNIYSNWNLMRSEAMELLQEESQLEEIVRLVGVDALSDKDRIRSIFRKNTRITYKR